jgi:hypothetical protein
VALLHAILLSNQYDLGEAQQYTITTTSKKYTIALDKLTLEINELEKKNKTTKSFFVREKLYPPKSEIFVIISYYYCSVIVTECVSRDMLLILNN